MRLIMAVSADGFVSSGPEDKMEWPQPDDRRLFRLLTLSGSRFLLAGERTTALLPPLPGRTVLTLRSSPDNIVPGEITLDQAVFNEKTHMLEFDLIGGATVAKAAFNKGILKTVILIENSVVSLKEGQELGLVMDKEVWRKSKVSIGKVVARIYQRRF